MKRYLLSFLFINELQENVAIIYRWDIPATRSEGDSQYKDIFWDIESPMPSDTDPYHLPDFLEYSLEKRAANKYVSFQSIFIATRLFVSNGVITITPGYSTLLSTYLPGNLLLF